ncbi:hypothetical protein BC835DRAFT_220968 [Cytidiella melzeri]|nr:hypothetical protein BC835DRAFT_220968 [Cytidiella melzeri]
MLHPKTWTSAGPNFVTRTREHRTQMRERLRDAPRKLELKYLCLCLCVHRCDFLWAVLSEQERPLPQTSCRKGCGKLRTTSTVGPTCTRNIKMAKREPIAMMGREKTGHCTTKSLSVCDLTLSSLYGFNSEGVVAMALRECLSSEYFYWGWGYHSGDKSCDVQPGAEPRGADLDVSTCGIAGSFQHQHRFVASSS